MKLSIVIPARNEAQNVGATIDAIRARLAHERIAYEILVVDDGSDDGTAAEVLARSAVDSGVRLERNPGPHGFGYAVRYGLDRFTGEAVVVVMADGSDIPDDIVKYYEVLAHEELLQSSIAGLGVGALRCLRPLLVDGFGLVAAHAGAPGGSVGRGAGRQPDRARQPGPSARGP